MCISFEMRSSYVLNGTVVVKIHDACVVADINSLFVSCFLQKKSPICCFRWNSMKTLSYFNPQTLDEHILNRMKECTLPSEERRTQFVRILSAAYEQIRISFILGIIFI